MSWEPVTGDEDMEVGEKLRLTLWLRVPYNIAPRIKSTITAAASFYNKLGDRHRLFFQNMKFVSIEAEPPVAEASGRISPWALRMTFVKTGEGSPFVIAVAAIIALLAAVGIFVVVVRKDFEKFVAVGSEGLERTVLNPGFVIAALVAVAVFMRAR